MRLDKGVGQSQIALSLANLFDLKSSESACRVSNISTLTRIDYLCALRRANTATVGRATYTCWRRHNRCWAAIAISIAAATSDEEETVAMQRHQTPMGGIAGIIVLLVVVAILVWFLL